MFQKKDSDPSKMLHLGNLSNPRMQREKRGSKARKEAAAEMKHDGKQKSHHIQARKILPFFTSYKSKGPEETLKDSGHREEKGYGRFRDSCWIQGN